MPNNQPNNIIGLPDFNSDGRLPAGIYWTSWETFAARFGHILWRTHLLMGLRAALAALKAAGCQTAYIDGSFVTAKELPRDFDGCWSHVGVDPNLLDPVLLDFDGEREAQKAKYYGEFFIAEAVEGRSGLTFLEFFQRDKETGHPKGIVALDLWRMK